MQLGSRPIEVHLPDDPAACFKLRKPSWIQEQESRDKVAKKGRKEAYEAGGEFVRELQKFDPGETEEAADKRVKMAHKRLEEFAYDLSQFDLGVLFEAAILDWPYKDKAGAPVSVNAETIAKLDAGVAKWLGQEIVDLMKPPTEEEEKNSARRSTGHSTARTGPTP